MLILTIPNCGLLYLNEGRREEKIKRKMRKEGNLYGILEMTRLLWYPGFKEVFINSAKFLLA
jgi:hypothetical protein